MSLSELLARAGVAKEDDEQAWLAQRRAGVTATEVRDLATGKKSVAALVAEKRNPPPRLDNRQFAWGRAREGVLGDWLRGAGFEPESRVFHAAENPRWLASPDAVGVDFDGRVVIAEVKTSKHDLGAGSPEFEASGYNVQMQWQMLVTGAQRCFFVVEQHDDDWVDRGGEWPEPEPLGLPLARWVERDDRVIAGLEELAAQFLAALDSGVPLSKRELSSLRVAAEAMAWHKAKAVEAEARVREIVAGRQVKETLPGKKFASVQVSFTGQSMTRKRVVDEEMVRATHPNVWEAFVQARAAWEATLAAFARDELVPSNGRLTVKGVKDDE